MKMIELPIKITTRTNGDDMLIDIDVVECQICHEYKSCLTIGPPDRDLVYICKNCVNILFEQVEKAEDPDDGDFDEEEEDCDGASATF